MNRRAQCWCGDQFTSISITCDLNTFVCQLLLWITCYDSGNNLLLRFDFRTYSGLSAQTFLYLSPLWCACASRICSLLNISPILSVRWSKPTLKMTLNIVNVAAHFPLSDKWTRFWTYVRGMMNVQNHNWIDYYCSCSFHIWPLIARYVWYRLPGVHRCHHYTYMAIVLKFKPLTTTYIHSADVIFFSFLVSLQRVFGLNAHCFVSWRT